MKDIRYLREGNSVYMILPRSVGEESFQEKMLLSCDMAGLLDCGIRNFDGESSYYYDIRSKQPLDRLYEDKRLKEDDIKTLLIALGRVRSTLAGYLLDTGMLLLSPECIMLNGWDEPSFCCYPPGDEDGGEKLAEFLIERVDNEDEEAVRLAYGFYDAMTARGGNFEELLLPADKQRADGLCAGEKPDGDELSRENTDTRTPGGEESFYFREIEEDEEENGLPEGDALKTLGLCAAVIILSGMIYIFLFMHPALIARLGVSQESYLVVGALLTAALAGLIITILQRYVHNKEESEDDGEELREAMPELPDIQDLEPEEYTRDEGDEETVLLTKSADPEPGEEDFCALIGYAGDGRIELKLKRSPFDVGKAKGNDGVIDLPGISRRHARLEKSVGGWYVIDLNSTNGTRVNGVETGSMEQHLLCHKDTVSFGEYDFMFVERGNGV